MIVWHTTTEEAVRSILAGGFRDAGGAIVSGVDQDFTGVFISDRPLDSNEGAAGDALLEIVLDCTESEIADYELIEDGKSYREWLVPAELLNQRGRVRLEGIDNA